jgi:hypothetical protein
MEWKSEHNNMIFKIENISCSKSRSRSRSYNRSRSRSWSRGWSRSWERSWSHSRRKWNRSWSGIRIIRYRCDRSWSVSCRWDIKRSISLSRSIKYDF